MPLPPGFTLEQAPTVNLPPGFQLEAAPAAPASVAPAPAPAAPAPATAAQQFGRSAASLADIAVGIVPGLVGQAAYPFYRTTMPDEQAEAAAAAVLPGLQQPFGRAFGVTETPEYKGEQTRQILEFISANIHKGIKWLSEKTGMAEADVANMTASLSLAAPKVVAGVRPAIQEAKMATELALAPGRAERASAAGFARGAQIDAAKEAQRLGIALNPTDIQPGVTTRAMTLAAGERGATAIAQANKANVRRVALNDMGLPDTAALDKKATFNQARAALSDPYDKVKQLPIQQADDAMIQRLESLRADLDVIGAKEYAPAISKIVDDAIGKTQTGLTGEQLLKNIQVLRERARKTYNNKNATMEALDVADTNLKVATELESMIDNSIFNPQLLKQFRDARQKMARTYAYEGATDLNTGMVDVSKLARITSKDNALTGDIASLGKIGGNFPEAFSTRAATPWTKLAHIGRTGAAGSLGGLGGYAVGGYPGAIVGSLAGAGFGELGQISAASRIASPAYQRGLNLYDPRLMPVNQLAQQVAAQGPQGPLMLPYDPSLNAPTPVTRIRNPNDPNWVFGRESVVTPMAPEVINQLPPPAYQTTINALRAEELRRTGMARAMEQQGLAAEAAAPRIPARGEIPLDFDPITGRLVPSSQGIRGATPETFSNFGASLETAANKVTAGQRFQLTAAEKVAWERTRADLAEVAPGMNALTDKAIANKMLDRAWVEQTMLKAREKADAFDRIAARAADERTRQVALANRERLMDLVEQMESTLGPRPVRSDLQGPKTRNALRQQSRNSLTE